MCQILDSAANDSTVGKCKSVVVNGLSLSNSNSKFNKCKCCNNLMVIINPRLCSWQFNKCRSVVVNGLRLSNPRLSSKQFNKCKSVVVMVLACQILNSTNESVVVNGHNPMQTNSTNAGVL